MQLLMKVLIVDDNAQIRQMMKFYLNGMAEETRECVDGAEACAAYAEFQPDWVLMDIAMGEMDGITATAQIVTADPTARVIIVTSYDGADLRQAAGEAGACGFVLKENLLDLRHMMQANGGNFV